MGGGKGKGKIDMKPLYQAVQLAREQFELSKDLYGITKPAQQAVTATALDVLRGGPTGQIGAIAPLITRSVEASNIAGSKARKQAEEQLATMGLTGTPFGQQILQTMQQEQALQASQIPSQMASDFYQMMLGTILPLSIGQAPTALQGMGQGIGNIASAGGAIAQTGLGKRQLSSGSFLDLLKFMLLPI